MPRPAPKRAPPGSGLGLQLCRSLLGRAGGSLDADIRRPDSTLVVLRLPVEAVSEGG